MKNHYIHAILALGLTVTGLNAFGEDAATPVASVETAASSGFYGYADFARVNGAGYAGKLYNAEASSLRVWEKATMQAHVDANDEWATSSIIPRASLDGNLSGGTIGYRWTAKSGDAFRIEASSRSGSVDATVCEVTWGDSNVSKELYKQDIDEFGFIFAYTPKSLDYLTLSLEYVHCGYDGRFTGVFYAPSLDEPINYADYGYESDADDILIHATIAPYSFNLFSCGSSSFVIQPVVDVGIGYSFRSGELDDKLDTVDELYSFTKNGDTYVTKTPLSDPLDMLEDGALVVDGTATVLLKYVYGRNEIIAKASINCKADIGNISDNSQTALVASIGYARNW